MAVRLTISETAESGSEYVRCFVQDRVVIGRARSADICLPDMAISMRHAEIRFIDNDYGIVDLASMNGTMLNDKELVAHRPRKLKNDDVIMVAGFRIQFRLGVAPGPAEARDLSLHHAQAMLGRILARTGSAEQRHTLVVVDGPVKPWRYELPPAPISIRIGREATCDIQLDHIDISREHAELRVEPDAVFIRDLESQHGVVIDGERIAKTRLEPGQPFTLGQVTLLVEHAVNKSLNEIFEAPEEETSSFTLGTGPLKPPSDPPNEVPADNAPKQAPTPAEPKREAPPVTAIGPADPLIAEEESRPQQPPAKSEDADPQHSDIGLIIVGAIIVLAAVAGLVYLFS